MPEKEEEVGRPSARLERAGIINIVTVTTTTATTAANNNSASMSHVDRQRHVVIEAAHKTRERRNA
jgi:hypothetical protein